MNTVTRDGVWLKYFVDADGMGELEVRASSNGFSGRGSAWFNSDELRRFAAALAAYPLGDEARRGIESGYRGPPGSQHEVHVALSAYQIDARGSVGVRVRLATPVGTWRSPEARHAVEMEFPTTYSALTVFATQLSQLAAGTAAEAALLADYAT